MPHNKARILVPVFLLLPVLFPPASRYAQSESAGEELLQRSLSYHDPSGAWRKKHLSFQIESTNTEGRKTPVLVKIHIPSGLFQCKRDYKGSRLEVLAEGSDWTVHRDGEALDKSSAEEFRWVRDYYEYMLGIPMKLRDRGTVIDPEPRNVTFHGQEVLSLKVTYKKEIGNDTWYFYFHPQTAALVGCRFYHDETKNDGEYLLFDGEVRAGDLRLPATRKWYTNQEGEFLGTDSIQSLEMKKESTE